MNQQNAETTDQSQAQEQAGNPKLTKDEEMTLQNAILKFVDDKIRPALIMDGGDMTVVGFNPLQDGRYEMNVQLVGACGSCPSSAMTMKMGVERMVMQNFPMIAMVNQI